MTDHQAACAALREAHAAIKAGNLELAELAVREARMAIKARTFLHPGIVKSKNDHQFHFVGAGK